MENNIHQNANFIKTMRARVELEMNIRDQQAGPVSNSVRLGKAIESLSMVKFVQGLVVAYRQTQLGQNDRVVMIYDILNDGKFAFNLLGFGQAW